MNNSKHEEHGQHNVSKDSGDQSQKTKEKGTCVGIVECVDFIEHDLW